MLAVPSLVSSKQHRIGLTQTLGARHGQSKLSSRARRGKNTMMLQAEYKVYGGGTVESMDAKRMVHLACKLHGNPLPGTRQRMHWVTGTSMDELRTAKSSEGCSQVSMLCSCCMPMPGSCHQAAAT